MTSADKPACIDCGNRPARNHLNDTGPLCDRCADDRLSEATGFPRLPDPPAPVRLVSPDGQEHQLSFRLWRAPTGIVAEATTDPEPDAGYQAEVLGDHDADPLALVTEARHLLTEQINHPYLEQTDHGLRIAGDQISGRLVWDREGGPHAIVIDGRRLDWTQLGSLLEPFEGSRIKIIVEPGCDDARSAVEPHGWNDD